MYRMVLQKDDGSQMLAVAAKYNAIVWRSYDPGEDDGFGTKRPFLSTETLHSMVLILKNSNTAFEKVVDPDDKTVCIIQSDEVPQSTRRKPPLKKWLKAISIKNRDQFSRVVLSFSTDFLYGLIIGKYESIFRSGTIDRLVAQDSRVTRTKEKEILQITLNNIQGLTNTVHALQDDEREYVERNS